MKQAFITGINGQTGSYLAELLLEKGYKVAGLMRRTSEPNTKKIDHIKKRISIFEGDMLDAGSIYRAIRAVRPDEIYNFAAMSQVGWSFEIPSVTMDINCIGLIRIVETMRKLDIDCKVYQACSSEMFGKVQQTPQTEKTAFYPRSPYGASKLAAFNIARTYREAYDMKIYCGILFNHESPRRGEEFLSRKVCMAAVAISKDKQELLEIGNMEAKRDFGYAKEYVEWIWKIIQHETADDFVIGTGENHSVREWIEIAFKYVGIDIKWEGEGENELGFHQGKVVVKVNPKFYRPAEVNTLIADSSKSHKILGYEPKVKFKELVEIMTQAEIDAYV